MAMTTFKLAGKDFRDIGTPFCSTVILDTNSLWYLTWLCPENVQLKKKSPLLLMLHVPAKKTPLKSEKIDISVLYKAKHNIGT